jgi:hypothetical protein
VIAAAFINNPANRQYQPRAYASDYTIPERVYQYSVSLQQELPYKLVMTAGLWALRDGIFSCEVLPTASSRSDNDTGWHDTADHFRDCE